MTAHAVACRHRIQGRLGIAYRYRRFALLLLFLACTLPATAEERSRQINEMEQRIANLQRDLTALDREHFQQTQAIETNRKHLADEEDLATVGSNWQAAADHYLKQIREREQVYEDTRARSYEIAPEDQSWLDYIYLGFIKASQRRIPRAVSGLYDRINARSDWMTYRRSLDSEMRAGIELPNEPYPRRFEGYDDFARQAQAEVLKSETARSNCATYRENIARAEQRQSEIDQEQRQVRTQIRQLEHQLAALGDQPVEPAATGIASDPSTAKPTRVSIAVDPSTIEATPPQGHPGVQTRTYRFFLLAKAEGQGPVGLRLKSAGTEPLLPHVTSRSAYTHWPERSYSMRPGEVVRLEAYERDLLQSVEAIRQGLSPESVALLAGSAKHLGPFFLTTSETGGFWGVFTAETEVQDSEGRTLETLAVRWEPFPKPQVAPPFLLRMLNYEPQKSWAIIGSHSTPPSGFDLQTHVVIEVTGLELGVRRILVDVPGRGRFSLYALIEPHRATRFVGWIPVPLGTWDLIVRICESEHMQYAWTFAMQTHNQYAQEDHKTIREETERLPSLKQALANARSDSEHYRATENLIRACEGLAKAFASNERLDIAARTFREGCQLARNHYKAPQPTDWRWLSNLQAHLVGIACHVNNPDMLESVGRERLESLVQRIHIAVRTNNKRDTEFALRYSAGHCFEMAERMTMRDRHDLAGKWFQEGVNYYRQAGEDINRWAWWDCPNYAAKNGIPRK